MDRNKWLKVVGITALVAWLLMFPATRAIIRFLLPLGSGWDDIVEVIALIVLAYLLFARGWIDFDIKSFVLNIAAARNTRLVQVVLLGVSVIFLAVFPPTGKALFEMIFYGITPDPILWVVGAIVIGVNALVWLVLKFVYTR